MSKEIKLEIEEQVLKALSNIENTIFSSDKFEITSVNYNADTYEDDLINLSLDIDLKPVSLPVHEALN